MLELRTRYYRAYPPSPSYRERLLRLLPQETVLLHVDVQGRVSPPSSFEEGASKARGLTAYTFGWPSPQTAVERRVETLGRIERVVAASRAADIANVFVVQSHPPDLSDAGGEWGEMHQRTHGLKIGEVAQGMEDQGGFHVDGSASVELPEFVRADLGDIVVRKHKFSAFFQTPLDTVLRNLCARNLLCTGFMVNGCLGATMLDAFQRGYRVVLVRDCTTAAEHQDTAEQRIFYQVGVRFVEGWLGYTCTQADLVAALSSVSQTSPATG